MSILLRNAPRSTILPLFRSYPVFHQHAAAFHAPRILFVSGYGKNPSQAKSSSSSSSSSSNKVDPVVGGDVPEYSGPSIGEKQKSGPAKMSSSTKNQLKEKRDQDFERTKEPEHDAQGKPTKRGTKIANMVEEDLGQSKRKLTTFTPAYREWSEQNNELGDNWRKDIDEDATRMKQKAKNNLDKAKLAAEDVSIDMKEGVQQVLHGAKKVARKVKNAASSAASSVKSAASGVMTPSYINDEDRPLATKSHQHQNDNEDMYERDAELYPTSDAAGAEEGFKLPTSDESAAAMSGSSMDSDVHSVKKSLFDGPQDMPQGVGRRAKSADGKPMETGTERS